MLQLFRGVFGFCLHVQLSNPQQIKRRGSEAPIILWIFFSQEKFFFSLIVLFYFFFDFTIPTRDATAINITRS